MQYSFQFTSEQVNLILSGLGKLPAEVSFNMITLIQQEATKQEAAAEAAQEATVVADAEAGNSKKGS